MTIAAVADTHPALWYLFGDSRLSAPAAGFIERAASERCKIAVSSITLAEIVYLIEKGRVAAEAYRALTESLADPEHTFTEAVVTGAIVEAMRLVPREQVSDLPDRMIAATALYFNVPVISRDRRIRAANVSTLW